MNQAVFSLANFKLLKNLLVCGKLKNLLLDDVCVLCDPQHADLSYAWYDVTTTLLVHPQLLKISICSNQIDMVALLNIFSFLNSSSSKATLHLDHCFDLDLFYDSIVEQKISMLSNCLAALPGISQVTLTNSSSLLEVKLALHSFLKNSYPNLLFIFNESNETMQACLARLSCPTTH